MAGLEKYADVGTEKLAQTIYESQREYLDVENVPLLSKDWIALPEYAREGYIVQAQHLLKWYRIIPKVAGDGA